jgi:environmental stress-induced protein Ves
VIDAMLHVLTPRDYRVMPWKNGGGTTTEIWIHPEGAGWDDFEWRVGIADIGSRGRSRRFPGSIGRSCCSNVLPIRGCG